VAPQPAAVVEPTLAPEPSLPAEPPPAAPCAFGELCLGPVFTLGGFNPFGIGVHARYGELWGFGFDYQFLPDVTIKDSSLGMSLFTIDGRLYPLKGAFFLSAGLAFQGINGTATGTSIDTSTGETIEIRAEGDVTIPMLKLGIGLLGHDGFVVGIDLALGIPLGGTAVDFEGNGTGTEDDIQVLEDNVQDAADTLIDILPVIPQLNLLRIGYIF
ncbi:MAG: hypothetical protein OXT09_27600, partial [Myxococcales bacterium]|nr:hypothetical protein [Myxococcales bacterium]